MFSYGTQLWSKDNLPIICVNYIQHKVTCKVAVDWEGGGSLQTTALVHPTSGWRVCNYV